MPMDNGNGEAAILVFAKPKKAASGVLPPKQAISKLPMENGYDEEECEYCKGEGCEHCEKEDEYESDSAEGTHKSHMKVIAKLAQMLEEKK
jgi:hypothetical protein